MGTKLMINRFNNPKLSEQIFVGAGDTVYAKEGAEEYGFTIGKAYVIVDISSLYLVMKNDHGVVEEYTVEYFEKYDKDEDEVNEDPPMSFEEVEGIVNFLKNMDEDAITLLIKTAKERGIAIDEDEFRNTLERIGQKKTKIISGFPGVGKSILKETSNLKVLDSDSSPFSKSPDFPKNYIDHIKKNIGEADYILVSSHDVVRKALEENDISYTLVYPSIDLKEEYMDRYKRRGSSESFINFIDSNWNSFIESIEKENHPVIFEIRTPSQFLSDILDEI